jgi:Protein of unknown function (DUF1592)/Protein of unknown function (DUF1588)/Protein of unknown function (DUF1585)/Protein of unknown function (DUF1595)/Protein of unknown function (DUF1587)
MFHREPAVLQRRALLLLFLAGCTGGTGGGGDRGGGAGGTVPETMPPIGANSLERNPGANLVCEDPDALNVPATAFNRLSPVEYVNTLRDLVAPIVLPLDLGSDLPSGTVDAHGFDNNWKLQGIEDKSVEQIEAIGHTVSTLVMTGLAKLGISGCPARDAASAPACADAILANFAPRAFRRELQDDERLRLRSYFDTSAKAWGHEAGLSQLFEVIIGSPQFLYKVEKGIPGDIPEAIRLSGDEIATRLAYLLTASAPDSDLREAAAQGRLDTVSGVIEQFDRLMDGERLTASLKRFSSQWLRFTKLGIALPAGQKDGARFPMYNDSIEKALTEGMDRFVEETLLADGGSVETLLSSDKAWVNDASAPIYDVKAPGKSELVEVALDSDRRRGFLTQGAVMAGFAHAAVHAPIQRGVFVLDALLCSPPPAPPPNIPTAAASALSETLSTRQKTVMIHEKQGAACQSCHERIDAVGFAFENYDGIGRWQDEETAANGDTIPVDASSSLTETLDADGEFPNAIPMIEKLSASEQVKQCFVENFMRYAFARDLEEADGCAIARVTDAVVKDGGSFRSLIREFVKTPAFLYRTPSAN